MRGLDSSTSVQRGTHLKRSVLAAAVVLCCALGIGTAVAASASSDGGTAAPSGASEALQTASYDTSDGSAVAPTEAEDAVQTLAADTSAVIDDDAVGYTTLTVDLTDSDKLQPTVYLDINEENDEGVTVAWGDGTSQKVDETGDGITIQKAEAYKAGAVYDITISSAYTGDEAAYTLGQGFNKSVLGIWGSGTYGTGGYQSSLTKVTTAANAGVQLSTFEECDNLTTADLTDCNLVGIESFAYMFCDCRTLSDLTLPENMCTETVTSLNGMFDNCYQLESLDLSDWDTSKVTGMSLAFGCSYYEGNPSQLETLDLTGWDTSSVTSMTWMFAYDESLTEIKGIEDFDTENVTDFSFMFRQTSSLTSLDLSEWDTKSATIMIDMFDGCTSIYKITLGENFTVSPSANPLPTPDFTEPYVSAGTWQAALDDKTLSDEKLAPADISKSFGDAEIVYYASITDLEDDWFELDDDAVDYTGSNVAPAIEIIGGDRARREITTSDFTVTYYKDAGEGTRGEQIDEIVDPGDYIIVITGVGSVLPELKGYYGGEVEKAFTVAGYTTLTVDLTDPGSNLTPSVYLDINEENDEGVTVAWGDGTSQKVDETGAVTVTKNGAYDGGGVYDITIFSAYTGDEAAYTLGQGRDMSVLGAYRGAYPPFLTAVTTAFNAGVQASSFDSCVNLKSADLSECNTTGITDFAFMFCECNTLSELTLVSGLCTDSVTSLYAMFYDCYQLTSLDLSGWNTSSVTDMSFVFGCNYVSGNPSQLTTLNLSNWDTSSVTSMYWMFGYDESLTEITGIEDFDTENVEDFAQMFCRTSSLTSLDLSGWDTSSATDMSYMFDGCTSIYKITLGENFAVNPNYNPLPTPDFTEPYVAAGTWQAALDDKTLSDEKLAPADISKNSGDAKVVYYASITDLEEDWFTLSATVADYTGQDLTPTISNDLGLETPTDYTIAYYVTDDEGNPTGEPITNLIEPGNYVIVLTGTGHVLPEPVTGTYGGELTYTFKIVKSSEPSDGGSGAPKVGDTVTFDGGQYTITSNTTARYNWPLATTTKANVATVIHKGGKTFKVTAVDNNAFKGSKKLTVIKIGDNVASIPNKAFAKCTKVTEVRLGKGVKTIGKQAFSGMSKLKKVQFKGTKVKKIGASCFKGCKKFKKLTIKSKKLKKAGVKKALKGSKVKTVKTSKKLKKAYKKIFTKKICGAKVKVK